MPKKEKKAVKTTTKKEDRQYEILAKGVYKIFDRTPNGSVLGPQAKALLEKLNKA